jgi:hypothetical protein
LKTVICLFLLALAAAGPVAAELETTVDLTALAFATRDNAGAVYFKFAGQGSLLFSAIANPHVKADCELAAIWSGTLVTPPDDILKRLFVKVNFDGPLLLAGKTRVSWGEGFVFNAGDLLFGSLTPVANLSESILRDNTDWLVDLTLPLGDFTYLEGIVLPFSPLYPVNPAAITPYDLRGGGRFVTKLAGLKIETGYLFRADNATHNPYLTLQGSLFFDFNLSAALSIPAVNYTDEQLQRGFALTAGLFRMFQFEDGSVLSVRLEGAVRPFGLWEEPAVQTSQDIFGLLLYPEIAFSPMDVLSFQLRAMWIPVNNSGLVSFGCTFGIYQGLNLIGYLWTMWGDSGDALFGMNRDGDMGLSLGLNFIY